MNENYCFFGVSGVMPSGSNIVVVGDVFMNNFYTIYDIDNMQIGIAKSINGFGQILDSTQVAAWAIPFIIIGVALILTITGLVVAYRLKRQLKKERAAQYYGQINEQLKKNSIKKEQNTLIYDKRQEAERRESLIVSPQIDFSGEQSHS